MDTELFEFPNLTPLDICLLVSRKREFYTRKQDVRDELLARILDSAARINKSKDQLRRTTCDLRKRVAKCSLRMAVEF